MNGLEKSNTQNIDTDIAILGGGGSGLAAAVAAAEKGAKVLLIEKRRNAGGNSVRARGIFAAESHIQKQMKIDARREDLIKLAMTYSHCQINPRIISAFINKSGDTIRWLEEKGVKFDDVPHFLPNQIPRVFHSIHGTGSTLIKLLVKKCEDLGVQLLCRTAAKRILTNKKGQITLRLPVSITATACFRFKATYNVRSSSARARPLGAESGILMEAAWMKPPPG